MPFKWFDYKIPERGLGLEKCRGVNFLATGFRECSRRGQSFI